MRNTNSIVITVEESIRTLPIETREILQKIRKLGKKLVPESTEAVKYGMPTLQINGKSFFHFCGYKNHIGIYPATGSFEMKEMEKYRSGKGTYQLPLNEPIPYELIAKMILIRAKSIK